MKVCIAEKPSVAREIAFIIGAKSKKNGYFEGNGYAVTWTFGHFCTLKTPDDYKAHWKRWDLYDLPLLPERFETKLIENQGVKKQFKTIQNLLKKAELVINCGDAGQEGELIQRWVLNQAKYKGKVLRLWISSLTPEAIKEGFKNLKDAKDFDNLYYAGSSRAIGDWLLGMNATRLFTLKYGSYKQVLSVGRVQTPTLAMLVERFKEIQNFVPMPYWELHTLYREVDFHYEKGRFLKKEEGEKFLKQVEDKPFTIVSFVKKKGREYPPRLYDLTSLQVHCNKRFSYSADQTLKLVQSLYEKKVVTYPRVDTTYLPNDVYPKIGGILKKMTNYSQFTQPLLGTKIRKSSKVFNDKKVTDHHAIIPTGIQKNLPINEQHVYDAIARQFIAAFYPDCIVAKTTVIGEVDGVRFKATGKEILEPGWRVLFPKPKKKTIAPLGGKKDNKNKKEDEKILPTFKEGETGEHEPSLVEKETKPPKQYTEATLLQGMETAGKKVDDEELRELMKSSGIGRPATRANIIETLFKRKYVQRKKKNLIPTEMGIQLIDLIDNDLIKSAELTGQWEKQLRDIESGDYFAKQFINNMKSMVSKLVEDVRSSKQKTKISVTNTTVPKRKVAPPKDKVDKKTCPKCKQGTLLRGKTGYGCSRWQAGCKLLLPFVFMKKKLPEKQLVRLMEYGSTIQLKGFKQDKKSLTGKVKVNEQGELIFVEKKAKVNAVVEPIVIPKTVVKEQVISTPKEMVKAAIKTVKKSTENDMPFCPKCGKGKIVRGKTAYGCTAWKSGCDFRFYFADLRTKAGDRKLTKELVLEILKG